jgi:hypothetical protein
VIAHLGPVPVEEFGFWMTTAGMTTAAWVAAVVRRQRRSER